MLNDLLVEKDLNKSRALKNFKSTNKRTKLVLTLGGRLAFFDISMIASSLGELFMSK